MDTGGLGLNLFVACVGVTAGPQAFHAIKTTGLSVFIGGMIITTLPVIVSCCLA
jgi:putative transport protein